MQPKKGKGREELAVVITEGGSGMKTQALWRYDMECAFFVLETVLAGVATVHTGKTVIHK